ncbi:MULTISPECIES: RnfH family protein [unclassified Francisella]|uniref:RnfH family protein n=1 Tax=unclassified Francisella TaxID=2610885 RepID=UPI002E334D02|nr:MULTISPECIES: RnfH family protein [unclassified Francisella]MED7819299.1 RnfH family protein [Francisella sp. 19S2-4]MED7830071.1 RnfH family protein [Francisella sp. 19S2-10]
MKVEVIYALPNEQKSFFVESERTLTVRQAIQQSKIIHKYPELENLEELKIGIYSEVVDLDHSVKDKDRVEIYRNLTIDPKQARMLRAEQKRKKEGIRGFGA